MSVNSAVKKTGDSVTGRFTIKNLPGVTLEDFAKPAYAVAGLADLAVEQVKEAPAAYAAEVKKAQGRLADVPGVVRTLPATVQSRVGQATDSASELYGSLAKRGRSLVTRIRRQPATQTAVAEGKAAVKKAEAATNAAKRSAMAGEKAVEGAAKKIG